MLKKKINEISVLKKTIDTLGKEIDELKETNRNLEMDSRIEAEHKLKSKNIESDAEVVSISRACFIKSCIGVRISAVQGFCCLV